MEKGMNEWSVLKLHDFRVSKHALQTQRLVYQIGCKMDFFFFLIIGEPGPRAAGILGEGIWGY